MRIILSLVLVLTLLSSGSDNDKKIIQKAKKIHESALTVDSHVDTPMWLTREGFDFGEQHDQNGERSKLDIPRMKKGGLDGVFFAVFLGQSERTVKGNANAYKEAEMIIDSIYATVDKYSGELEIALNSEDFRKIVRKGKRAIFLGMENAYPIGNNISKIDTFYHKGIRYITLCHSYNNDICDSSTDSLEFNGLSSFGEEVVSRMNDLGIMIDISHASDASVRQVIAQSSAPIIASHSCAKAICDNPRNLSDELILKLKENGGVVQLCILSAYIKTPDPNPGRDSARAAVRDKHGDFYGLDALGKEAFLKDWYQIDLDFPQKLASVSDMVDHIDHIVQLAGIDCVGIGTDFDGGGGLADCHDVSQMGNITLELVKRGYSTRDIKKIWGGNLMRVMDEVSRLSKN